MKLIKNILFASSLVLLAGCQADLLDTKPYDSVASGNMWSNENFCDMGVNGIYKVINSNNVAKDLYKFDSFGVTSDCRDQDFALLRGNVTTTDGLFSDYWKINYEGISRANDAIVHLPDASIQTAGKKERLLAEAKFMRAFFYYKLNMMYKGGPLYLEPTELNGFTKARNTEEEVWNQVVTDLTDAINTASLPDNLSLG